MVIYKKKINKNTYLGLGLMKQNQQSGQLSYIPHLLRITNVDAFNAIL